MRSLSDKPTKEPLTRAISVGNESQKPRGFEDVI